MRRLKNIVLMSGQRRLVLAQPQRISHRRQQRLSMPSKGSASRLLILLLYEILFVFLSTFWLLSLILLFICLLPKFVSACCPVWSVSPRSITHRNNFYKPLIFVQKKKCPFQADPISKLMPPKNHLHKSVTPTYLLPATKSFLNCQPRPNNC